jgi:type VI secretion system protein ImpM
VGVFGKLPARGDFLAHGLPASFTGPWHGWLVRGLAEARRLVGDRLAEIWRVAPAWRFVLAPGLAGPAAVAGVLVPSVDAVGRAFPLTLARLAADPFEPRALVSGATWLDRLEAAARAALVPELDLEAWLRGLDGSNPGEPAAAAPARLPLWLRGEGEALADALGALLAARGGQGLALFWSAGSPFVAPGALLSPGLPEGRDFLRLLVDPEGP